MALPASGPLSMSQINGEFGRGTNLNAYRGTDYYTSLAGAGPFVFPATPISFNDFYGTQVAPTILPSLASLPNLFAQANNITAVSVRYETNGNWIVTQNAVQSYGAWYTPTTAGIGSSYWIRYTKTYFSGYGAVDVIENQIPYAWTPMSPQLTPGMLLKANGIPPSGGATSRWTVEIATDAAGTNIVAIKTNWEWQIIIGF